MWQHGLSLSHGKPYAVVEERSIETIEFRRRGLPAYGGCTGFRFCLLIPRLNLGGLRMSFDPQSHRLKSALR